MQKNHSLCRVLLLLTCNFFFALFPKTLSASPTDIAGSIINLEGTVDVSSITQPQWQKAIINHKLFTGDIVRTGNNGKAHVLMSDETMFQLSKNSTFQIKKVEPLAGWLNNVHLRSKGSKYWLQKGRLWFRNKTKDPRIDIETPNLVATIRGTEFDIHVDENSSVILTIQEGQVEAWNQYGSITAQSKEQIVAEPGKAPYKKLLVDSEEVVQWTITLPPSLNRLLQNRRQEQDVSPFFEQIITDVKNRNYSLANDKLNASLKATPNFALAHALRALVEILTNQPNQALTSAKKAVELDPQSVFPYIMLAYANQSLYRLEEALAQINSALILTPDSPSLLTMKAKLLFALNKKEAADVFLKKALTISPEDSEVLNLYGYLLLAKNKDAQALSTFQKAASIEPSIGDPHLGMALSLMRQGKRDEALKEISIAVLLEPQRSIYVSYWGKMLYQFHRFNEARSMFQRARELDKNDPTPDLYEALVLNILNRPGAAIRLLRSAETKNDNRAVYRSRFLLDQDNAVINMNQTTIFSRLGLDAWARYKAMASVKKDPFSSSAHLMLAGSLQKESDFSLASTSEQLLARILMPVNSNSFNSFNEYTSFFEQPEYSTTITGKAGSHKYRSGELLASGAMPQWHTAFGLSAATSNTDGWHDYNTERQDGGAILIKTNLSEKNSVLLAAGTSKTLQNDQLRNNFMYDRPPDPEIWRHDTVSEIEVGLHHRLAPQSSILTFFGYKKNDSTYLDHANGVPTAVFDYFSYNDFSDAFYQWQIQLYHNFGAHKITTGISHHWEEGTYGVKASDLYINTNTNATFLFPYDFPVKKKSTSFNLHDSWHVSPDLQIESAIYVNRSIHNMEFYGSNWTLNQTSPQLGLIYNASTSDILRIAGAQTLYPFFYWRLDPMDIAGISLYRQEPAGTISTLYAAAWDHEWQQAFTSLEFFSMNSSQEFFVPAPASIKGIHSQEASQTGIEIKTNVLLTDFLSFTGDYSLSHLKIDPLPSPINNPQSSTNHLFQNVSGAVTLVHPSGISGQVVQAYRNQQFSDNSQADESLWVTDIGISYEFPEKSGKISLEIHNFFDNHFNWHTERNIFTGKAPVREVMLDLSLNF